MSSSSTTSTQPHDAQPESIIEAVIEAVLEVHGSAPQTPLYQAIDPDALEQLYQHSSPTVQFEYIGYQITIDSHRAVSVSELA